MKILHVSDLHLTDRPQDEYRWRIFEWIMMRIQNGEYDALAILGDLTEAKDHHSAALIHRLTKNLKLLGEHCPVFGLMGNHDYVDPKTPFFGFISEIRNVQFIAEPTILTIKDKEGRKVRVGAVPHMHGQWCRRNWEAVDRVCVNTPLVWLHQTFSGAKNEAGKPLTGFPADDLAKRVRPDATLLAGDVHTPQQIGRVIYVGAPYPIDFGDDYQPRAVIWENGKLLYLKRSTIKKTVVYATFKDKPAVVLKHLSEGDRVRVVVDCERSQLYRWERIAKRYRSFCKIKKIELSAIEPRVQVIATAGELKLQPSMHTPHAVLKAYAKSAKDFDEWMLKSSFAVLRRLTATKVK